MTMKCTKRLYPAVWLAGLLVLLSTACQKETLPVSGGNKTVQINLSTRVGNTSGTDAGTPAEDAIHTLRIYAFDENNNLVGYHYDPSIPDNTDTYSFSMPLNFSYKEDFPTGSITAKFYLVVNEGAATIDYSFPTAEQDEQGDWVWEDPAKTTSPTELSSLLITGYGTKTERDISEDGLPMSYKKDDVEITTETNQTLEFGLERAVVKLETTFTNQGTPVRVSEIQFGTFQADKGYLFPQDNGVIVPNEVKYNTEPIKLSPNLQVGQGQEAVVSYYQLPSAVSQDEYTFGFALENGTSFGPAVLKPDDGTNLESIDRNTELKIAVTVKNDEIGFGVPEVRPWGHSTGGIITVE